MRISKNAGIGLFRQSQQLAKPLEDFFIERIARFFEQGSDSVHIG